MTVYAMGGDEVWQDGMGVAKEKIENAVVRVEYLS